MVTANHSDISADACIESFNNQRNYPKRKLIRCFLKLRLYSDNEEHIPPLITFSSTSEVFADSGRKARKAMKTRG